MQAVLQEGALSEQIGLRPARSQGGLELHHFPDRGHGWVARRPFAEGELLLAVPLKAILVAPFGPDSEAELAACLLQVHGEGPRFDGAPGAEPKDEIWCAYTAAAFPPSATAAALTWDEDDIEALEWPSVVGQLLQYAAHLRTAVESVADYTGAPLERARWAVNAVVSRSFAVNELGRALVPFADLFNDRPMATATWSARRFADPKYPETPWSLRTQTTPFGDRHWFELQAMESVEPGDEVLICYGEGSRAEVLAVHGYLPEENEADFIKLFASPDELVAAVAQVAGCRHSMEPRLSRLHGAINVAAPLAVRPGGLSAASHLLSSIEVALATEMEFAGFQEVWSAAAGHAIFAPPASLPMERKLELRKQAVEVASKMVSSALAQMTPAEKDAEEVNRILAELAVSAPSTSDKRGRRLLAAHFRLGVKSLLSDFLRHAAEPFAE